MNYELKTLDEGQIIVLTMYKEFDMVDDLIQSSLECFELVENGPEHIVFISDGRELSITNLNDLIQSANSARRPEAMRVNKHPKMLKSLSVINSRLIQMAVRGLNSASFGHMEVTIFETVEDALDHARNLLMAESQAN
jgi:hypothetical protein